MDDRELLVRIDERTKVIHDHVVGTPANPGLLSRVDSLEESRSKAKGWAAGAIAAWTSIVGALEFLFHRHIGGAK